MAASPSATWRVNHPRKNKLLWELVFDFRISNISDNVMIGLMRALSSFSAMRSELKKNVTQLQMNLINFVEPEFLINSGVLYS